MNERAWQVAISSALDGRDNSDCENFLSRDAMAAEIVKLREARDAAIAFVYSLGEDEEEHPTLGLVRVSRADDGAEERLLAALEAAS